MAVSPGNDDDYLERVKAEIRAEAEAARRRAPLPRIDPPPRAARPAHHDGIEHGRLDYAIGELTGPHYRAFIDGAFRALLKRAPDDAGAEAQMRLLAAGAAKAEVLGNLRWSPEGRRVGVRVRGLLPRYALAKLVRVPVLGYVVEWGLTLAGLPVLLRHQRAADTSIAARFGAAADAQREHDARLGGLERGLADLGAEHDRRSDAIRDDIRRMLLRLDALEQRAARLEGRADDVERQNGANAQEMIDLRHYVHAANHWITSLQRTLDELERDAADRRERGDAFAAAVLEDADAAAARRRRHADWCGLLGARAAAGAEVLDLGSGDGAWLEALAARGFAASGVEANRALALAAQQRGLRVAEGEPRETLARCADASVAALTLCAALLPADAAGSGELLGEALRALRAGGCLLLRLEPEPYRFAPAAGAADARRVAALLAAAGFAETTTAADADAAAVLACKPA